MDPVCQAGGAFQPIYKIKSLSSETAAANGLLLENRSIFRQVRRAAQRDCCLQVKIGPGIRLIRLRTEFCSNFWTIY